MVSVKLAVMTVPIGLLLGIGLAVLADKHLRGIGFFRTVFSSTVATSVAVASLVWFVLLQPEIGVLSDLFSDWIPALKNPGLLRDPDTALPSVPPVAALSSARTRGPCSTSCPTWRRSRRWPPARGSCAIRWAT